MTWVPKIAGIGALLLMAQLARAAEPIPLPNSGPVIRVRLNDYAGVSKATLASAVATASQVLKRAGIRLAWMECQIHQDDTSKDWACDLPITSMDLQLRIIDGVMARRMGTPRDCLGYALLGEGAHSIAAVYFHRAVELERRRLADRAAILGAAMAHEIGHLLLEERAHSTIGIMRSDWGKNEDLNLIGKGRMWFTAEQARRMRSKIANRQRVDLSSRPR